ncbi:MAG TPA: NAD-dependent epimerase/dehydratase family protein [Ilumatobacteraceae bacterium]|jgi:nucleoside-diphosphate-sugar epimerase|nr:NAD-dependent epimerase/dehydratase family protein [Ilumatobacteraceae bacterium]
MDGRVERTVVVLTGAGGALGHRVGAAIDGCEVVLADSPTDDAVRALQGCGGESTGRECTVRIAAVVDLGSSDYDNRAARRESATESVAATLAIADEVGADHVVFVSSALVYGAAANNPVPLTEDAALRPDVEFVFARQLASAEELVEQWRTARPGRTTCVLRPAVALAADGSSRLATALVYGFGRRLAQADPPSQFLHLDDLAAAVAIGVGRRLDGVFNVAPDGWVPGERVRALSGERPRLPLPERLSELVAALRWRFLRGPIPPGLLPYTLEPWVVSNGRLRAAGWAPTVTNEQTYVESTEAPWWAMVSPKRRQELALGGGVFALAVGALVGAIVARRWFIRRRG